MAEPRAAAGRSKAEPEGPLAQEVRGTQTANDKGPGDQSQNDLSDKASSVVLDADPECDVSLMSPHRCPQGLTGETEGREGVRPPPEDSCVLRRLSPPAGAHSTDPHHPPARGLAQRTRSQE